mmetsp:Transcript_5209/g.14680  ORF Transcript_5209/g.14680 Transcript_5209/m.14680 type:complete len:331 (+) Transcript_5209:106-1098(+)
MVKHSKNNTAGSVFTYHERQMMGYGTKKKRLGADSIKNFDACCICLSLAVDPLACRKGHLFCRECILKLLLSQKKANKRAMEEYERQQLLAEAREEDETRKQKEEEVREFERTNNGLLPALSSNSSKESDIVPKGALAVRNGKGEVVHASMEERRQIAKTGIQLREFHRNSDNFRSETEMPSFWLPSMAPESKEEERKKPSRDTMCPQGHPIVRKRLVEVKLCKPSSSSGSSKEKAPMDVGSSSAATDHTYCCPSCKKGLSNAMKSVLLASCGHVFCNYCTKEFIKLEAKCGACGKHVRETDYIPLESGGTGFASHDKVKVKRAAPAARV